MKKSPLAKRRQKFIVIAVIASALTLIGFTFYRFTNMTPTTGKKLEVAVTTGDQPVKKELVVYVNADGGLSLRTDHSAGSERQLLIPNGTKLTVTEELEGWYKVSYQDKTGWIAKEYTTTATAAIDPTKDWKTYNGSGYKIKYQTGWNLQDYGKNDALGFISVVAFSNQSLPATIPAGSDFIAPVVVNLSSKTADQVNKTYAAMSGVKVETMTVAGRVAQKYTFTSPTSNTQVSTVIVPAGAGCLIFSEAGGYADDLQKMLNTLTIG